MSTNTPSFLQCPNIPTPSFPSLYIPRNILTDGNFLCTTYDAWRFTTLWTLIVYAAFYLAAASYAYLIQVRVGGAKHARDHEAATATAENSSLQIATGRTEKKDAAAWAARGARGTERAVEFVHGAKRSWKLALGVGAGYVVVGGIEAVIAGSVVGAA
jgi:hypothetical protein